MSIPSYPWMFVQRSIANYKSPLMETTCGGLMSQYQAETMFWCFMKAPISKLMNSRSCPTQSKFPGHCVCRGGCATCWGSGQPWPGAAAPPTQPQQGDTRPQPAQQGHIFLSLYVTFTPANITLGSVKKKFPLHHALIKWPSTEEELCSKGLC